jgi:hypothetical protein
MPGISVFNPGFPGFFRVDRLGLSTDLNKLHPIRSRKSRRQIKKGNAYEQERIGRRSSGKGRFD